MVVMKMTLINSNIIIPVTDIINTPTTITDITPTEEQQISPAATSTLNVANIFMTADVMAPMTTAADTVTTTKPSQHTSIDNNPYP